MMGCEVTRGGVEPFGVNHVDVLAERLCHNAHIRGVAGTQRSRSYNFLVVVVVVVYSGRAQVSPALNVLCSSLPQWFHSQLAAM
jgi:hypothetical protein